VASVDLAEIIPDLQAAVTAPGIDSPYASASDGEWLARLKNGFWAAFNDGVISSSFDCDEDGVVVSTETFGRDLQQIVIMYAGMNILQNRLAQINTSFKAKAGSVEYETQQSAQVLKGLLDSMLEQRNFLLKRLSDSGTVSSYYIDSVISRDEAIYRGSNVWWGA